MEDDEDVRHGDDPFDLAGIERILLRWQHGDVTLEGTGALIERLEAEAEDESAGPGVTREGSDLVLFQELGHRRPGSADLVVRLPVERCPAIVVTLVNGDLSFEDVRAALDVEVSSGDVEVSGGAGDFSLHAGHGDVSISRRHGAVTLQIGNGDVEIERCSGPFAVQQGHGDLQCSGCAGQLTVRGGSGEVDLRRPETQAVEITGRHGDLEIKGGRVIALDVHLTRGDVECTTALLPPSQAAGSQDTASGFTPGRYVIETGSGDVAVGVPRDIPIRAEVVTARGDVESEVPLVSVGRPGPRGPAQRFVGVTPGDAGRDDRTGRVELSVLTRSGDVQLRGVGRPAEDAPRRHERREHPGHDDSMSAGATARGAEVRAVLDALARGDLRVDEAERLLDALGGA